MNTRIRVRRFAIAVIFCVAASLAALPTAAFALDAPTILTPKPSALVAPTFVITGRVSPAVTQLQVTGATLGAVTILPADSEGATFTAQVTARYGRSDIQLTAGDGVTWSNATKLTVWQLGQVRVTPRLVLVDKSDFMLYVIRSGAVVTAFPVAIGMRGTPTPVGTFQLGRPVHAPNSVWGPFRMPLFKRRVGRVSYFVRVNGVRVRRWRTTLARIPTRYYIHGTNDPDSIGTQASHGCVRMFNNNLRTFRGLTIKYQMTIIRP
jgi:lipoprotein-anchoring transpeptidase ErfK/SrfK